MMEMNCKLLKERPRPAVARPRSPNYDNHLSPGILEPFYKEIDEGTYGKAFNDFNSKIQHSIKRLMKTIRAGNMADGLVQDIYM